jgi:hypothetical protein
MSSSMSWFETNRFNGPASAKNPVRVERGDLNRVER